MRVTYMVSWKGGVRTSGSAKLETTYQPFSVDRTKEVIGGAVQSTKSILRPSGLPGREKRLGMARPLDTPADDAIARLHEL